MPREWYPEFRKPLGPPEGDAEVDATGMVWTRKFKHASVFVDLRDRTKSKITWAADEYNDNKLLLEQ